MEKYRNAIESEFNIRLRGLRRQLEEERAKSKREKQQHKQELEKMQTKLDEEKDEKKNLQELVEKHETEMSNLQKINQKLLQDIQEVEGRKNQTKKKPTPRSSTKPKVQKKRVRDMSLEFPRDSRTKAIIAVVE